MSRVEVLFILGGALVKGFNPRLSKVVKLLFIAAELELLDFIAFLSTIT